MKKINLFKTSLKDTYYSVCAEITTDLMDMKAGKVNSPGKLDKALIGGTIIGGGLFASPAISFAAKQPELFTKAESILRDYYGFFVGISTLIAVVACVVGILYCMISGEQGTRKGVSFIKKVIFCWIAINCLGLLLNLINTLTADSGLDASKI